MFSLHSLGRVQQRHKTMTKPSFSTTALKMTYYGTSAFETFTTPTTAKLLKVGVYQPMAFQFSSCVETLWTFAAEIRLHTSVTKQVHLKVYALAKFLLTNVTV